IDLGNASAWAGAIITITGIVATQISNRMNGRLGRPLAMAWKPMNMVRASAPNSTVGVPRNNAASAYANNAAKVIVMTSPSDIFSGGRTGRLASSATVKIGPRKEGIH